MGCCPYPLLFVPLFLALAALAMTWAATFDCTFFATSFVPEAVADNEDVTSWEFGLWTARYYAWWLGSVGRRAGIGETCLAYDHRLNPLRNERVVDGSLRAARAFGLLSCIVGTMTFLVLLTASCCRFGDNDRKNATAGFLFLCGIMSLLMLVALNSHLCRWAVSCTLGTAGVLSIVAGLLWFVTGCCVLCLLNNNNETSTPKDPGPGAAPAMTPAPATPAAATAAADPVLSPGATQTKVEEKTVNADGTTTIKTILTTTNSDGSKTVTETTTVG